MNQVAEQLKVAIDKSDHSVQSLADATKIPRTTILALLDEPISCILPERVYLRGHLGVLADQLGADRSAWLKAFDNVFPASNPADVTKPRGMSTTNVAMVAGLGTVAVVAVTVAFVSVLG